MHQKEIFAPVCTIKHMRANKTEGHAMNQKVIRNKPSSLFSSAIQYMQAYPANNYYQINFVLQLLPLITETTVKPRNTRTIPRKTISYSNVAQIFKQLEKITGLTCALNGN